MKQLIILFVSALLATSSGFAQQGKKSRFIAPLVAEEPIRHLTISGNIDVLLTQDRPFNTGVRVPASDRDKLDARIDHDILFLSATDKLSPNERLTVYVTVNDLNSLELKGNVVVNSLGILQSPHLRIVTSEKGMVALRSGGQILVSGPASYQVIKENGHYSVFAGNL